MSKFDGIIDLSGLAEFKDRFEEKTRQYLVYQEKVFIGYGDYETTQMTEYRCGRQKEVLIQLDGSGYIYIAYPKNCGMEVMMGGISTPFENISETVIDDRLYNIDRSLNTYQGMLEAGLILKY